MCRRQLHVQPSLGHLQVVLTSLKNTVHKVEGVYNDDEISFILHISCSSIGVEGSTFGVLGFGCEVVERINEKCVR